MTTDLMKPALYRAQGTAALPDRPSLLGGECACGYVFFPMQAYGCERCGRTDTRTRALSGQGRLLASARVHVHTSKSRQPPFTVGSILLDDGPIVRTLLVEDAGTIPNGARVVARLVEAHDTEGHPKLDLRFEGAH